MCLDNMGMANPSYCSIPCLCCILPYASAKALRANFGKVPAKSWLNPKPNSHKKFLSVALTGAIAHRGVTKVAHPGRQSWH